MRFLFKDRSEAYKQRILRLISAGPEGPPVRSRKVCESCGGKGHIVVNGERRKCTVCKGTGYISAA